ncbi:MAG: hypothetical protein OXF06_08045 [Bacteroidetes bacterium]|nr:hypothetical protein [Bacteroidota bacterium]MCY4224775.1 hypothetical protein [Bacteroidota bacterium]
MKIRTSLRELLCPLLLFAATLFSAPSSFGQGTPWIAEPRTGSISVSYFNQNATQFYRGSEIVKGPLAATDANLGQNTVWIGANYALSDAVALDLQTGWAESYVDGAVGPSGGEENYSGLYDTHLSLTWRFADELVDDLPSLAVRFGATVPGGYDTGYINSLGDGGTSFEWSLIAGKFGSVAGVSGEFGYRERGSTSINTSAVGAIEGVNVDIPSEIFVNLWVFVPLGNRIRIAGNYRFSNSTSGIDIGDEDFSPSRFPELEEDRQILGGRVFADLFSGVSAYGFYGSVVGGRNTAKSTILGFGLSVALGGGFGGGL